MVLILGGIFTKVSKGTSFLVRDGILYITLTVSGKLLEAIIETLPCFIPKTL